MLNTKKMNISDFHTLLLEHFKTQYKLHTYNFKNISEKEKEQLNSHLWIIKNGYAKHMTEYDVNGEIPCILKNNNISDNDIKSFRYKITKKFFSFCNTFNLSNLDKPIEIVIMVKSLHSMPFFIKYKDLISKNNSQSQIVHYNPNDHYIYEIDSIQLDKYLKNFIKNQHLYEYLFTNLIKEQLKFSHYYELNDYVVTQKQIKLQQLFISMLKDYFYILCLISEPLTDIIISYLPTPSIYTRNNISSISDVPFYNWN